MNSRFIYSVLRFVPDPVRGEFINIGAIVGSEETSEWELRLISNPRRARALASDAKGVSVSSVWSYLDDVGIQIDAFLEAVEIGQAPTEPISEAWLSRLWESSQNVVQLSAPTPLLAGDLQSAVSVVFDEFIIDPESRRFAFKKKNVAAAAVRRAFRSYELVSDQYVENTLVIGPNHKERFDFTVANGSAVQLTHTFSLQVPDKDGLLEDIKAWAFTVEDIKRAGGEAITDRRRIPVPRGVPVSVVYIPSENGDGVLSEARKAFERIEAESYPLEEATRVAATAYDRLTHVG